MFNGNQPKGSFSHDAAHTYKKYLKSTFSEPILLGAYYKSSVNFYLSRCIRKPTICICENKGADQLCGNCTARILKFLFFLNPKFPASSHHSLIFVRPGPKPRLLVFSGKGSFDIILFTKVKKQNTILTSIPIVLSMSSE